MKAAMSHENIRRLLGAYALDATEDDERAVIDEHLAECLGCRAEVNEHRGTVAHLAETELPPPPELWSKISNSLEDAPPPLNLVPLGSTRIRRSFRLQLAAAFSAAAALVAFLGIRVVQQERRISALEAGAGRDGLIMAAAVASADPKAERITLRSADESLAVAAVLLPDGRGYIVSHNLPSLTSDRTYQLWALVDEVRISLGVMDADKKVVAFRAPVTGDALAITEELAGGVATSSKAPIVVGLRQH